MGLIWGLFRVIIASVAQLSLGFAASPLPPELKNGGIKISRQALKEWVQRQQ